MEEKATNITDHFHGRLYIKRQIKKWDLPSSIQDNLGIKDFNYFFLTTSIEKDKQGHEHHVHFCLFPTKHEPVFLLEVETPKILPKLLHECLQIVKNHVKNILTSTGFCKTKELCYFGIFFSVPEPNEKGLNKLRNAVNKIDEVRNVNLFKYLTTSKNPIQA